VTTNLPVISLNTSRAGGGVVIPQIAGTTGTFIMHNGIIRSNFSTGFGGGVSVGSSAQFTMHDGEIYNNRSNSGGGGVHVTHTIAAVDHVDSVFNMHGGTIRNNRYTISGDPIPAGGGVYVIGANSAFTMTGGTIGGTADDTPLPPNLTPASPPIPPMAERNVALLGGGVWVGNGASFVMELGGTAEDPTTPTIVGNETYQHGGGGVFITGLGTTFDMYAGIIERNTDSLWGSGVLVTSRDEFTMRGGEIRYHVIFPAPSLGQGGASGVGVRQSGRFYLHGGEIHSNFNQGSGAGVNLQGGAGGTIMEHPSVFHMFGGQIHNNTMFIGTGGGGLRVYNPSAEFEMHGGTIRDNTSHTGGGGIAVSNNSFTMTGGYIYGNRALGNNAHATTGRGGGILFTAAAGDTFTMTGGTIGGPRGCEEDCEDCDPEDDCIPDMGNTAIYGGGVFINSGTNFVLTGAASKYITGNDAQYDGGGVWVAETGTMRMETSVLHPIASNVTITNNIAGRDGGGIFTERLEYADPLTLIQGALNPAGVPNSYSNLSLLGVTFGGNTAIRHFLPPINAAVAIPTAGFVAASTSQPDTVPLDNPRRHPLNNYDINFRVPLHEFEFLKADQRLFNGTIVLLEGALFRLYRNVAPWLPLGTTASYLALSDTDPRWEPVIFESGLLSSYDYVAQSQALPIPTTFLMDHRHSYQLVEIMAPAGFQIPFGQWRITSSATTINNPVVIGGHAAGFVRSTDSSLDGAVHHATRRASLFYLGNLLVFELPLTGGTGSSATTYAVAGGAVLGSAAVLAFFFGTKKKKSKA